MRLLALMLIGVTVGVLHYYHVKTLHENDRFFSHLSNLEREMGFRSEMGLYYSFFKRLVVAPSFIHGMHSITNDNLTEFPDTVNALTKFNIYPEVISASMWQLYKQYLQALNLSGKQCFTIRRGDTGVPVLSCDGLGEPSCFYVEVIWIFAGLTAFTLFCYGTLLSNSIIGGCITALCFFINHAECTRVQWTPPLRESFGYPIILLHCLVVTFALQVRATKEQTSFKCHWKDYIIFFSTLTSLLFWQLSIFLLTCEIAILMGMYAFDITSQKVFKNILTNISAGFVVSLAVLMGNRLLCFSYLSAILVSAWILLLYDLKFPDQVTLTNSFLKVVVTLAATATFKESFPRTGNDSHITKILLSKVFGNVEDFHTLMYTCAPEFQALSWSYGVNLTKSFLLPLLIIVLVVISLSFLRWMINMESACEKSQKHPFRAKAPLIFNVCLLIVYFALSMMAMRLKLFLTPHICILVSFLASKQTERSISFIRDKPSMLYSLYFAIFAILCYSGIDNIYKQHKILGEFSNPPLEELLTWVQEETNEGDVFAGPMPVMANILLSTGRPIVNHPYYEDEKIRIRTVQAYSVFSRKAPQEVFDIITTLRANYVILEANKCFDNRQPRKACKMTNLWDIEDPKNSKRPPLCPQLFKGDASPFIRVFENSEFVALYASPKVGL